MEPEYYQEAIESAIEDYLDDIDVADSYDESREEIANEVLETASCLGCPYPVEVKATFTLGRPLVKITVSDNPMQ